MVNGREEVLKLIEEKETLEKEIFELNQILIRNHVGMEDPLVDHEGFPLANIDVYQVRHARHLLKYKQNDHKDLMRRIEEGIATYYQTTSPTQSSVLQTKKEESFEPFAKIRMVNPGSPADIAGIKDGDLLLEFGSVNAGNFLHLQNIGEVVKHSEGHKIQVRVKRNERVFRLMLTPKQWNGNGLLGCTVHPI